MQIPRFDGVHAALSVALSWAVISLYGAKEKAARALKRALTAEQAVKELREKPETAEFRIERFEVLWFPVVTASIQNMEITGVNVGVPHCAKCAVPLGLSKGEWVCARCEAKHPESMADTMVLDSVAGQAIKYFQERRPGYRVVVKGLKP